MFTPVAADLMTGFTHTLLRLMPYIVGMGVVFAGLVVGGLGVVERAQRGVPAGFEGAGDEPVGGVDGQVAAAGQVGEVLSSLDMGGAERVGLLGAVLEFG